MTCISRTVSQLALIGIVTVSTAATAWAQQPAAAPAANDARWAAWMGCWHLTDETVTDRDATLLGLIGLDAAPTTRGTGGARVCVSPAADSPGVTMTTLVNERPVLTETIVADGSRRLLAEPDCEGWQKTEWATGGTRVFASAEITCKGQSKRTVSGLAMLMTGPKWVDVQMIESDGRKSLRVRRYYRVAGGERPGTQTSAREVMRQTVTSQFTIADVKEANTKVEPEVLQAAILELKKGFDLSAKRLVELSQADVPESVIDLMVALTFPEKFVVERASSGYSSGGSWSGMGGYPVGFGDYWPWYSDPFFYTSMYSPYGYSNYGRYNGSYFSGPGFVVIDPGTNPGEIEPSGTGRVVDGRGYTRVTTRQPERSRGDGSSGGLGSSSAGSSGSDGGSSSGSSGASSGGYSSGGGGGGGRTAQPRPPGN